MVFSRIFKVSIVAFLCGLILGLLTFVYHSSILLDYAQFRIPSTLGMNPLFIFFNNVFVLALVFFGGQFFSLVEIKSSEVYPEKVYLFLEKLSSPLDKLFSLFDRGIMGMRDPYKACYFILFVLPVMIIFLNILFFISLFLYLTLIMSISFSHAIDIFVSFLWPLGVLEFSLLFIAAYFSLSNAQSVVPLLKKKNLKAIKRELRAYLSKRTNWSLFLFFCILLLMGAFHEAALI
jgi:hypothetical protein